MKKPSRILLAFAAMIMLFAFGCVSADMTDGLGIWNHQNQW